MNDHDHSRALTILYATESGGAQDAANKIARRCQYLNFECQNVNIRDYPLVRFFVVLGVRQNPSNRQTTSMYSRPSSTRLS